MVRPVFGNRERDEIRDANIEDATTISRMDRNVDMKKEIDNSNMVTKEQAEEMVNQAATRAVETTLARRKEKDEEEETERRKRRDDDERENSGAGAVISSKTVKELQSIAGVFNALKEFSSNPLQKAIENKVGDVAAGVVERAFSPPQSDRKKDIIDQILNSQFAAGFGASLGQRGPELVNSLTTNFGREKVDGWISGTVGKGGGIPGASHPGMPPGNGQAQSEAEMILGLDPNNPEHVAAYASSQGGMSIETARKVLQIHQDDLIRQIQQKQGPNVGNVQGYRRRETGPPPRVNDDLMVNTPITEDKRWDKEDEKSDTYVDSLETQNVDLHPEMERTNRIDKLGSVTNNPGNSINNGGGEIADYLKNLNNYIVGLKKTMDIQSDTILKLQGDLIDIKRDRMTPEDMIKIDIKEGKIEKDIKKEIDKGVNIKDETEKEEEKSGATIRNLKSIKKGKMED